GCPCPRAGTRTPDSGLLHRDLRGHSRSDDRLSTPGWDLELAGYLRRRERDHADPRPHRHRVHPMDTSRADQADPGPPWSAQPVVACGVAPAAGSHACDPRRELADPGYVLRSDDERVE